MKPPLPRIETAVPRLPHVQLEIAKAIRTLLGPNEDELARQRRTEITAIRRDFEALARDLPKAFEEAAEAAKAEIRVVLRKYSPDQPRVPAGNRDGGQWTSGSKAGSDAQDLRYAANGTFPPLPEGYDPNTWKQKQWPNNNKYFLEDPEGNTYTVHPEDGTHWRHWDKQDSDNNDQGRWPPNSRKPWPGQKKLKEDQSWSDPNGDSPPWTPDPFTPGVPEPVLPARPIPNAPIRPSLPSNPFPRLPIEPLPELPTILFPE
jgi:hypothetical protein